MQKIRNIALLMTVVLLVAAVLSACSNDENQSSEVQADDEIRAMGRYIQQEWKLPEQDPRYVFIVGQKNDGSAILAALNKDAQFSLYESDLATYALEVDTGFIEAIAQYNFYAEDIAMDDQGRFYALCYALEQQEDQELDMTPHILRQVSDNQWEELPLDWYAHLSYIREEESVQVVTYQSIINELDSYVFVVTAGEESVDEEISEEASVEVKTERAADLQEAGESTTSSVLVEEDPYIYPSTILVGKDGDILLGENRVGVTRYSSDGQFLTYYANTSDVSGEFILIGDSVCILDSSQSVLMQYDYQTGKERSRVAIQATVGENTKLAKDSRQTLYLVTNDGIYALTKDGSIWERLVEGDLTTLRQPSMTVSDFLVDDHRNFYLVQNSLDGNTLISRFVYSSETPTRPIRELTVVALQESSTLRQAAVSFQRTNPQVHVNIQVLLSDDSTASVADAVEDLTTRMRAGDIPDVILLDGLPIDDYVADRLLDDLSGLIEPMVDDGELLSNITERFYQGDRIYYIPTRIILPLMWSAQHDNGEYSENWTDLHTFAAWAETNSVNAFRGLQTDDLILTFYGTSAGAWFDARGNSLVEPLEEFLEDINRIASLNAGQDSTWTWMDEINYQQSSIEYRQSSIEGDDLAERRKTLTNISFLGTVLRETDYFYQYISGMSDVMEAQAVVSRRDDVRFSSIPGQVKNAYQPSGILGILHDGTQKELAAEFVKHALSTDIQKVDLNDGLPVNPKALDHMVNEEILYAMAYSLDELVIDIPSPEKSLLQDIVKKVESLENPVFWDQTLLELIITETSPYFAGTITAKEAAQKIVQLLDDK